MVEMQCSCDYRWEYNGQSKRATCPSCGNKCTVATHRLDDSRREPARGPRVSDQKISELIEKMSHIMVKKGKMGSEIKVLREALETAMLKEGTNMLEIAALKLQISALELNGTIQGKGISRDNGIDNSVESRLLDEIMKAPAGTDEHINRQLEAAHHLIKKFRSKRQSS